MLPLLFLPTVRFPIISTRLLLSCLLLQTFFFYPAFARTFELTPTTAFAVSSWSDPCRLRIAIERNYLIKQQAKMQERMKESEPLTRFIGKELEKLRLPSWLIWLPLLESGYRSQVVSSAGAAGLWQLMPETAQRFGLTVSMTQDERLMVPTATRAALQYLKWLQNYFSNDWALILAAYNSGEKRVRDAQSIAQSTSYCDLKLPAETQRYVPRFLAMMELLAANPVVIPAKPQPVILSQPTEVTTPQTIKLAHIAPLVSQEQLTDAWLLQKLMPVDMKGIGKLFDK